MPQPARTSDQVGPPREELRNPAWPPAGAMNTVRMALRSATHGAPDCQGGFQFGHYLRPRSRNRVLSATSSTWGERRVRRMGKTQVLFDDNRFSSGRPGSYNRNTGEAETSQIKESPARNSLRMRRDGVRYFYTDFPKKLVLSHHISKEHR